MRHPPGRYDSFIIRVWSRDQTVLHGQVTHVATRRHVYFRDVHRLIGFMLGCLSASPSTPPTPPTLPPSLAASSAPDEPPEEPGP